MDWLASSLGKQPDHPIEVASLPAILADIKKQGTKYGSIIEYYEAKGLVKTKEIRVFKKDNVLIIGNSIVGDILKDGFVLNEDNPLRKELFTLDEIDAIRKQYGIKEVFITHLEEDWGKSYDDYRELERELHFIHFAYDGLKIQL